MNKSPSAKELEKKLRKLWDNDDYVDGIIAFAESDKNINIISQFIDMSYRMGDNITADDISYLVEAIRNKSDEK